MPSPRSTIWTAIATITGRKIRRSDQWGYITTREVDARASCCCYANHKIAGGGGYFHREAHQGVHCQNLKSAAADAEQTGKNTCYVHHRETKRCAGDLVGHFAPKAAVRVGAREM